MDQLGKLFTAAGFEQVTIEPRPESRETIARCMPGAQDYVASAIVSGKKPDGADCCEPSCCA